MDKPLVIIKYKTADGSEMYVEVSTSVKRLLQQSERQIHSQRRQDRRYLNYMDSIDSLAAMAIFDPQQVDTADLIAKAEYYRQLHAAIGKLSDTQRRRLLLHFAYNLTYRHIAALEGVNFGVIARSIKRALANLRKQLAE